MNTIVHYIGLDVHKESIAVAIAPEGGGEVRHYGIIGGSLDALAKLVKKLSAPGVELRLVYEAGPCGFVLCRFLRGKGYYCEVVAPSRPGLIQKPSATSRTLRKASNEWRSIRDHPMLPLGVHLSDDRILSPNRGPIALLRQQGIRYQSALLQVRLHQVETAITTRHGVLSANELSEVAVSAAPTPQRLRKNQAQETACARHFRSSKLVRMFCHRTIRTDTASPSTKLYRVMLTSITAGIS